MFLELNGVEMTSPEDDYERLVLQAAQGLADKALIADFFRNHAE